MARRFFSAEFFTEKRPRLEAVAEVKKHDKMIAASGLNVRLSLAMSNLTAVSSVYYLLNNRLGVSFGKHLAVVARTHGDPTRPLRRTLNL